MVLSFKTPLSLMRKKIRDEGKCLLSLFGKSFIHVTDVSPAPPRHQPVGGTGDRGMKNPGLHPRAAPT